MRKIPVAGLWLSGLILLSGITSNLAQSKTPNDEELQKRKAAEQVVIRAIKRFGQTLSFGDIYQKDFISDETIKRREMNSLIDKFIDKKVQSDITDCFKRGIY